MKFLSADKTMWIIDEDFCFDNKLDLGSFEGWRHLAREYYSKLYQENLNDFIDSF